MPADRDDRVLKQTHVLGGFIVPFLLVAFVLLYFFPGTTKDYFAWEIHPDMTPMIMGAGYIAGAYFFARVVMEKQFHRIHVGFLPVTSFTIFMAIASLLAPRQASSPRTSPSGSGWASTSRRRSSCRWPGSCNRRTDPGTPEPGETRLPSGVRDALLGAGAVQTAVALFLLISPSTMIDVWPWTLTPLTAQTLGGWFALPGITAIMMGLDGRPSAIHITLQSQAIGLALILLAAARDWGSFDTSNELSYVFVAGLGGLLAGLLALELYMRRAEAPAAPPRRRRLRRPVRRASSRHGRMRTARDTTALCVAAYTGSAANRPHDARKL